MFYPVTIKALESKLRELAPDVLPQQIELEMGKVAPICHLLWMIEEVKLMDTNSVESSTKAARFLAWILHDIEFQCLWDNKYSRDLVRIDVKNGFDRPH